MKYYKVLNRDGCSCNNGNYEWSLPVRNGDGSWTPGEWTEPIEGELRLCSKGYHICTAEQLIKWLNARIFEVEIDGEIIHGEGKLVCRKCRLVREITVWNEQSARLFACDCAEHVLHIFEKKYPDDNRPRKAIETAREFAMGEATQEELAAAGDAAWAARAAWDAAGDARTAWDAEEGYQIKKLLERLKEIV